MKGPLNKIRTVEQPGKVLESCPICRCTDVVPRSQHVDRRRGIVGLWNVWTCKGCTVSFINPLPSESEINRMYAEYGRERTFTAKRSLGSQYPRLRKLYHYLSGDVDPRDFVKVSAGGRLLDYGCGVPLYLLDFHRRGIAVSGVELDERTVAECRRLGLDVRCVGTSGVVTPFRDAEFDCAYAMQVLEHVREPHELMAELRRVVKPGGAIVLAVPNMASVWCRLFGRHWVSGWFVPFHLFYYSKRSIVILAEAHGLKPKRFWSATPEMWFRLNVRAAIRAGVRRLEKDSCWFDQGLLKAVLFPPRLAIDCLARERDCLVVELQR